jgi:hypothetical protein
VAFLAEKVERLEREAGAVDRACYMKGAAWMGKKVIQEADRHREEFIVF